MKRLLLALLLLPFISQGQKGTPVTNTLELSAPKSLDARTGKWNGTGWVPYASTTEANAQIAISRRYVGLTVCIGSATTCTEYWYSGGIGDGNLVLKFTAADSYPTVTAPSGFSVTGSGTSAITISAPGTTSEYFQGNGSRDSKANFPVSTAQATADAGVQAYSIQRANHTGSQTASTISDFTTAARSAFSAGTNVSIVNGVISSTGGGGGTTYTAGANISIAGGVISAIGSSSYADSAKVASLSVLDTSYRTYITAADKSAFSGSGIPTGNYYGLTVTVGNGRSFESIKMKAAATGNVVIAFFSNVAGVAHFIYSETTAVASTGYITIPYSALSIPDRSFAGQGDVYVGIRVLTAGIYQYSISAGVPYVSPIDDGGALNASTGVDLGFSIGYSQKTPIAEAVVKNSADVSALKPIRSISELNFKQSLGQTNFWLDTGTFVIPAAAYIYAPNTMKIRGSGPRTIIKSAANIYGIYVTAPNVEISDLTIDGGDTSAAKNRIAKCTALDADSNMGTKYGIYGLNAVGLKVHDVIFKNCNAAGVCVTGGGGSAPAAYTAIIRDCYAVNCYYGFKCAGEYVALYDLHADNNACGVAVSRGNVNVTACVLASNTVDAFVAGGANTAHAGFTGCSINHGDSTHGAGVYVSGTTEEERFVNCSFYEGNIVLRNAYSALFVGCGISGAITVDGGTGSRVISSTFVAAYGAGKFQYYNGGALELEGNRWKDGAAAYNINNAGFVKISDSQLISLTAAGGLPEGYMVYNTNAHKFLFWNGTNWMVTTNTIYY